MHISEDRLHNILVESINKVLFEDDVQQSKPSTKALWTYTRNKGEVDALRRDLRCH